MPELGKATYWLVLNTEEYSSGFKKAEATAVSATDAIDASVKGSAEQLQIFGTEAMTTGGKVSTAAGEMGTSMEGAAAKTDAASANMQGAMRRTGAVSKIAAGESMAAWRRTTASLAASGKQAVKMAGMAGLGLAYFVIKDGIKTLKANNAAQLQLNNAIRQSGDVQNVQLPVIRRIADSWMNLDGQQKAVTLSIAGMLTNFKLIRNEAGRGNDVFDRTINVIGNIEAKMTSLGKNIKPAMLSMMIGRMLTDPAKGMSAAGRAGIKFSQTQMAVVKHLVAANKGFEAQKYILGVLEKTYKGAGATLGKSFTGQWKKITTQFQEASAKLMIAFLPFFKILVNWLARGATWLSKHVALVKALIIGFGTLYGVIKGFEILAAIFQAILAPEELVVGAIAALVALFVLAVKYPKLLQQGLRSMGLSGAQAHRVVMALRTAFAWLRVEAMKLWPSIKRLFAAIAGAVMALVGFIRKHWTTIWSFLSVYVRFFVNTVKNDLQVLVGFFHLIGDILKGNWGNVMHDLGTMAWGFIHQLQNWGSAIAGVFSAFGGMIEQAFAPAINWVIDQINGLIDAYNQVAGWATGNIGKIGHVNPGHHGGGSKTVTVTHGAGPGLTPDPTQKKRPKAPKHKHIPHIKLPPGPNWHGGPGAVNAGIGNLDTGKTKHKKKAKKGVHLGTGGILGRPWALLQMELDKAETTKSLADDQKALVHEENFLKKIVANHANSLKMRLAAANALRAVDSKLRSLQTKIAREDQQNFNDRMAIELAKASLLGGSAGAAKTAALQAKIRKHELAMYTTEENALKRRLKDKKLTLHQQAMLWKQIAALDKKRIALAKQANADAAASAKELQAVMELRGSFFSSFAGNIFGESAGGGLSLTVNQPGNAPSKTVEVNQTNIHHQPPPNRHYHADQARRLSQGAFAGMH